MKSRKVKLTFTKDIPHLTFRTLSVLHDHNAPIIWMEVYTYVCYLNIHPISDDNWDAIKKDLYLLDSFEKVEEIDLLPFEEKDTEMKNVIDIIPHGVAVLSRSGDIRYINNFAAERVFRSEGKDITGIDIRKYLTEYEALLNGLKKDKGKKPISKERLQIGNMLFETSLQYIKSKDKGPTGYLVSFYDIDKSSVFSRYDNPISFDDIIGESNKMLDVINQGKLYSSSDSPVLITGESGTGKELFARAIHNESTRKGKPFIAINCAALPDQLLESELFGYEPGTFTGGTKDGKAGIFEVAENGTVFLDEIGEMPPHLQAKLLRVLQEKKVRRVGGTREIPIDVRLISATNQNIDEMVRNKEFRLDLLFRINIFNISIPPLRERKEDIPILIEHFTRIHSERYGKSISGVDQRAVRKLINYNWPGNVREFQNVLERAVALSSKREITEQDIIINYDLLPEGMATGASLSENVENLEKRLITQAIENTKSIREAAKELKVTHTLLINRMKKYGISKSG